MRLPAGRPPAHSAGPRPILRAARASCFLLLAGGPVSGPSSPFLGHQTTEPGTGSRCALSGPFLSRGRPGVLCGLQDGGTQPGRREGPPSSNGDAGTQSPADAPLVASRLPPQMDDAGRFFPAVPSDQKSRRNGRIACRWEQLGQVDSQAVCLRCSRGLAPVPPGGPWPFSTQSVGGSVPDTRALPWLPQDQLRPPISTRGLPAWPMFHLFFTKLWSHCPNLTHMAFLRDGLSPREFRDCFLDSFA